MSDKNYRSTHPIAAILDSLSSRKPVKTKWYDYLWLLIPIGILGLAVYGLITLIMLVV